MDGQVNQFQKIEIEGFTLNSNSLLVKTEVNDADFELIESAVYDKSYLEICDFDDHFENISNDWMNRHLFN